MARMEHLNSFFIERLMSVAGEIFEAVKDTVSEYQEEIERTKQENRRLREILTEISLSASSEIRAAGNVSQRHDFSVHVPVLLHGGDQEPDRCVSFNALGMEGRKDDCLRRDSFIAIKLEPCNSQVPQLSSAQIQSGHHLDSMESETGICPRPYRCDLCGKSYGDAHVLRVHLKTHSTERPFRCNSCGKMYKKKSHLKDHERTHTGDKRYSCSACGMSVRWHTNNHLFFCVCVCVCVEALTGP
uniref:C2H2-type domain-containing protein n=1 Tax=Pygocentrus nattereri TaxID=42514 RepID=A0AAR2JUU0_PYGNA